MTHTVITRPVPRLRPGDLGTPSGRHLVALDIDGTTVDHCGTLSQGVVDAVQRTIRAGHRVVIATGRALLGATPVLRALGLNRGYVVCSNGAVTAALDPREPGGHRVLNTVTFDPAPVISALKDAWPGAQFAVEELGTGFKVSSPFPENELEGHIRVVPWQELAETPATRVTFRSANGTAEDFIALAERVGLHGVNYAVGFTAWLDIAPDGVSKASALEEIRRRLRIPKDRTVAVGDQRNDLEMLRWAACGVAMGNAPAEVQDTAGVITASVDDDGVVDVLDALPRVREGSARRTAPIVAQTPRTRSGLAAPAPSKNATERRAVLVAPAGRN